MRDSQESREREKGRDTRETGERQRKQRLK